MTNHKNELRKQYKNIRKSLSPDAVKENSASIAKQFFSLPEWQTAKTVMCYLNFLNEVDTHDIYLRGMAAGKTMLIPICAPADGIMEMSILPDFSFLVQNRYGIEELPPEHQNLISPNQIDLCIIPGIAFDRFGNRIGFGAGYYDRYLPKLRPNVPRVALAHSCQISESALPADAYDLPMDKIITEKEIILCR